MRSDKKKTYSVLTKYRLVELIISTNPLKIKLWIDRISKIATEWKRKDYTAYDYILMEPFLVTSN